MSDPTRRDFLSQITALGLALGAGEWSAGCAPTSDAPPNIVLIFMDDQGWGDVGVYGAEGFETPHLDRLAAEGMRFTDFYASQAVCSASRASLLTGCYSERVSILGALGPNAEVGLHPDEVTIAEMLKARGYATAAVGKWHLGHMEPFLPLQHGFDEYLGVPYSNDMWRWNYDMTLATSGGKSTYPLLPLMDGNETVEAIDDQAGQDGLTTRYTERAVDFIDRAAGGPFFLYLAHSMVHVPLGVSDRFRGSSEQGMFGDVMQEVDWSVGQVMEALERNGVADNTLVIFTSDNGPWLNFGNHAGSTGGFREGKGTALEGGPRVPGIWRWPGHIPAGTVSDRMASTLDVLPTVAAVTSAALPGNIIDGVSLLPVLEGDPDANPRNHFFYYYGGELRGVREGRWKRVYEHRTRSYVGVEPGMDGVPGPYAFPTIPDALYDLEADPAETIDVADRHPDVVARLDTLAEEARATLGDRLTGRRGSEVREPGRRRFERLETLEHLAVGAPVTLAAPPHPPYTGQGPGTLTDGELGTRDHHDGRWLGWQGEVLDAVVDLGEPRTVRRVGLDCLISQEAWIFLPRAVDVLVSDDGGAWTGAGRVEVEEQAANPDRRARRLQVDVDAGAVRYVRVLAQPMGPLPDWHAGSGGQAWIFADEIIVEG